MLSDAVDALTRAGVTVLQGWPADLDPIRQAESFGFHVELFFAFQDPEDGFSRASEFVDHERQRMAGRAAWQRYFQEFDVFVCPTNFTSAFRHDTRPFEERTIATPQGERPYTDQVFWITHAALAGLPALSAPVGRTASGLPVGMQVIGPIFEDDTDITLAELLADVIGGFESLPLAPGEVR